MSTTQGVLVLVGPNARETLAACTDADVSNDAFKFLTAQEITVAGVDLIALRVGFTGARGWELHMPVDQMGAVYDALCEAGAQFDIRDFGNHALNSLRIEKMYLTRFELTHDIGPEQANVGFFVKEDKGDFIGKDALNAAPTGNAWKLVYMEVDADSAEGGAGSGADCLGGEGVFASTAEDAAAIGVTTSGGYGYSVEKSLAFAYVDEANAAPGTELGILILNEMRSAVVLDGPVFDPENKELRG